MESLDQQNIICQAYLKELLSAQEICDKYAVSIHKVYRILGSNGIARRSGIEQNSIRFFRKEPSFNIISRPTKQQKLLIASALMLYAGEGAKSGYTVDFVNSNVNFHKVFLLFLREVCQVQENRLKLYLYCFSDQNLKELFSFWSEELNIPISRFTKPYIKKSSNFSKRKITHGVLHIRYSDKKLLYKLIEMIDDLTGQIIHN